ncbi:MAG TPA: alanine racemase [Propionibacteriaceae bacterium]|nr:alanine racemase [Propionibacteriaceae bacterium]
MRPIDDRRFKGLPLPAGVPVTRIGDQGWNALRDLDYPVLVLHEEQLRHNIATMADYCRHHRVELAPHAKTSLSPQLIRRQMEAGAWGATAATAAQVRGLLTVGVPRILLANLLVDPVVIRWIASHVVSDGNTGFSCYVDSVASVEVLERECGQAGLAGQLDVLVEVGYIGGRTGVRSLEECLAVARAVDKSEHLCLVGVAGYEGLMPGAATGDPAGLDAYLESIAQAARQLDAAGLFAPGGHVPVVTAGGSSYFDRVVAHLGPDCFSFPVQTVLRSGCYLTHDHGIYRRTSPFDGRGTSAGPRLQPALELLASVLSRPEPRLVIVGFGRRDAPFDDQLPVVLGRYGHNRRRSETPGVRVTKLNDQHAFLEVPEDLDVGLGEVWSFGISHPCGAFDRWPAIPLVDQEHRITGAVTTDL